MRASSVLKAGQARPIEEIAREFAEQGYARVGRLFSEPYLAQLRSRADEIMLGEVSYPGMFFQHDAATGDYSDLEHGKGYVGPSLGYRKIEKLELDPLFRRHIEHPTIAPIVHAFIDDPVVIYRAVLFCKGANGGTPLPWHQDGGRFWGVDPAPFLQVWTALDDCGLDAGCVDVIAGSHREGLASPLGGLVQESMYGPRQRESLPVPAVAGEVLLINNFLWHSARRNRSGRPRRTVSVCYMSGATRCLRKKRAPREFVRVLV